jgi:hypothetical protein
MGCCRNVFSEVYLKSYVAVGLIHVKSHLLRTDSVIHFDDRKTWFLLGVSPSRPWSEPVDWVAIWKRLTGFKSTLHSVMPRSRFNLHYTGVVLKHHADADLESRRSIWRCSFAWPFGEVLHFPAPVRELNAWLQSGTMVPILTLISSCQRICNINYHSPVIEQFVCSESRSAPISFIGMLVGGDRTCASLLRTRIPCVPRRWEEEISMTSSCCSHYVALKIYLWSTELGDSFI